MLINIAKLAATNAHAKQVRKFTGLPYITHPAGVVAFLEQFNVGELILAGGWCHDIIEDCNVTYEALEMVIGTQAVDLVQEVTNLKFPVGTPRIEKFWANFHKLTLASHQAQTLKCGDCYDNCKDVYDLDPEYATLYIAEKWLVVSRMVRAQADVRDTVLSALSSVYLSMSDTHQHTVRANLAHLERACPDQFLVQYNNVLAEMQFTPVLGGMYGTASVQNA